MSKASELLEKLNINEFSDEDKKYKKFDKVIINKNHQEKKFHGRVGRYIGPYDYGTVGNWNHHMIEFKGPNEDQRILAHRSEFDPVD
jgi:hypothetical protein